MSTREFSTRERRETTASTRTDRCPQNCSRIPRSYYYYYYYSPDPPRADSVCKAAWPGGRKWPRELPASLISALVDGLQVQVDADLDVISGHQRGARASFSRPIDR